MPVNLPVDSRTAPTIDSVFKLDVGAMSRFDGIFKNKIDC